MQHKGHSIHCLDILQAMYNFSTEYKHFYKVHRYECTPVFISMNIYIVYILTIAYTNEIDHS